MNELPLVDVGTRETFRFVTAHLPSATARVLEIGCGSGRLATELARRGVPVRGLEPDREAAQQARRRGVDVVCAGLLDHEDDLFDLVLFSRSLHHIHPLDAAIERVARLLKPGGTLLVEDFAVEAIDAVTAAWRYETEALLRAAGLPSAPGDVPDPGADPLARWRRDHETDPPISDSAAMKRAVAAAFTLETDSSVPYLYRYLVQADARDDRSSAVGRQLFASETRLITAGALRAIGLRLVARRR